jgi:hypothetical protein
MSHQSMEYLLADDFFSFRRFILAITPAHDREELGLAILLSESK